MASTSTLNNQNNNYDQIAIGSHLLKLLQAENLSSNSRSILAANCTLERLGIAPDDIEDIKKCYSTKILKPFVTAYDYFAQNSETFGQIRFRQQDLDKITDGGIDVGMITEICGEAGSGKSQICIQLALNAQMDLSEGGLNGKAVFISTEQPFPSSRLAEMEKCLNSSKCFSSNIFLSHYMTGESLTECIINKLPRLLESQPTIKLIIIDSIAGAFRLERDYIKRANLMRKMIEKLECLANEFKFAVVITNQIYSATSNGREVNNPAMGLAWANLIGTRLQLFRTNQMISRNDSNSNRVRQMKVIFSPRLPQATANFIISTSGITEI
ncbi:unnamed protein product [Diamesa serratosioi]